MPLSGVYRAQRLHPHPHFSRLRGSQPGPSPSSDEGFLQDRFLPAALIGLVTLSLSFLICAQQKRLWGPGHTDGSRHMVGTW